MSIDNQIQVVLIDDDPHLRQALCQTLDLAGLNVLTLGEGATPPGGYVLQWPAGEGRVVVAEMHE